MERLQKAYPSAHFVKAFNSVGNGQMVNPQFAGGRPTMFICGNDAEAKRVVRQILDQFGWDTEDMGAVEAARAIEPLCMLWCIPGIGKGDWSPHAFKLLRKPTGCDRRLGDGAYPKDFVYVTWAVKTWRH